MSKHEPWRVQDFSGHGSKVVRILPLAGAVLVRFATAGCKRNVIVEGIDRYGNSTWWPVNSIGDFVGNCLADGSNEIHAFKITCDGSWVLSIRPLAEAHAWQGGTIHGEGCDVVKIPGGVLGFSTLDLQTAGRGHSAVWAYHRSGHPTLLFNEIGPYRGQTVLPGGTTVVSIESQDQWSLNWQGGASGHGSSAVISPRRMMGDLD